MNERAYFSGRIEDLISREQRGEPFVFSGFLTAEEAAEAEAICRRAGAPYLLYCGYPASERKMLAISSLDEETLVQYFPIVLLQIVCGDADSLTHRDVLGALMALGIRRDVLGDIIVRDGCALFFAAEHIRDFLIQNLSSIGRQNVRLLEAAEDLKIPEPQFESLRITVASPRADAVVGALGRFSREQAAQAVSPLLEILSVQTALIPTSGQYEVLCHEFKCSDQNGRHYIVYVNAQTGQEEHILILLEDESGTLVL